jgi:tetratricopeptide (TPR) repeat protein
MNRNKFVFALCFALVAYLTAQPAAADYKQAVAYYNQGRFDKAIQELKPDVEANPEWEFGHRLMGLCYLSLKNNALAVTALNRAMELKSPAFSTYLGLAQAYFNLDKPESSVQALNRGAALASKEKDPQAELYKLHHLRGSAYYRMERFNEAMNDFLAALRYASGDWTDYSQLGISYYNLNRYDDAVSALQKALSLRPGHPTTAEFMGKALFKKGVASLSAKQYDRALEEFKKARDYDPRNGFIHYNIAEALLFQKKYGEAEKALNFALEIMPRSAEVYQRLGLVYEKQKKWDQSLNAYRKAYDLNSSPGLKEAIARVSELKTR